MNKKDRQKVAVELVKVAKDLTSASMRDFEDKFKDERYWSNLAGQIKKLGKKLNTAFDFHDVGNSVWKINSKNPVAFPDGTIGKLIITISPDGLVPKTWFTNADIRGRHYGGFYDHRLKKVTPEIKKRYDVFNMVKKYYPNAKLSGNTINLD